MTEKQMKADQEALERFYKACSSQGTDPKTIRDPSRYLHAWDNVGKRLHLSPDYGLPEGIK